MAIAGIAIIAFALSRYDMNVKAATTSEDFTGIAIGAVGAILLILALIWSGMRKERPAAARKCRRQSLLSLKASSIGRLPEGAITGSRHWSIV